MFFVVFLVRSLLVGKYDLLVSGVVVHYKFLEFYLIFFVSCDLVLNMMFAIGRLLVGHLIVL